jgi:glycine hydroxymethyltransferase
MTVGHFPFAADPDPSESAILNIVDTERERQWRQLIMIPSESICHPAALELLCSEFNNVYAEGLPQPLLCHDPRESALDEERFWSWQARLSDRRFYKGTVNANRVELLAQKAIADVFAKLPGSPPSDEIFVNVQALSGAAANQAVYVALLEPGDRVMGLDLAHGGHLTHGSQFNFSGKRYEAQSYGVDESTRRLDYDRIRRQALEWRPKLLIGGASGYSWDFDWAALRRIADEVGAYLLADIAHLAGLVAGGVAKNPVPHAHVVTFTTHKTLCGPRGAVILSADGEIGRKLDSAVFPGLQGGPHVNKMAAIGRLFELILSDRETFCAYQKRVVENCQYFAECLTKEGFTLEYRGTNTHMVLVDLKQFSVDGPAPLDGEIAARLLELAGIVCNKNVLPGDPDGAHASGLRFGLPWLTQRGVTQTQLREIANVVKTVLQPIRTFSVWTPSAEEKCRGRIAGGVIEAAEERTLAIAEALPWPPRPPANPPKTVNAVVGDRTALLLRGDKVRLALGEMLTARLPVDGSPVRTKMLRSDGCEISDVTVAELPRQGREERWALLVPSAKADEVMAWVRQLSEGYLLFDSGDLQRKVPGPTVVEKLDASAVPESVKQFAGKLEADPTKPSFIGQPAVYATAKPLAKPAYEYVAQEVPLRRTVLNERHKALGAKMAPFAGWEMPIQYPSGIAAEHSAVRTAAGLFDVSHMSAFEFSGPHALEFLEGLLANAVSKLDPGEAQYSCVMYPEGRLTDDVYLYRLERERFMLISNAANAERVKDWVGAVNGGEALIDLEMPGKRLDGPVAFRALRDAGKDSLVGMAFQGPLSLKVLQELAESRADKWALAHMAMNTIISARLAGLPTRVARTGYTGERLGFEIYVHPDKAGELWDAILETGRPLGVLPAGLGARDSTRVEAGLPLFGHDLEGDLGISPTEAGYGFTVQLHVPFFIGRNKYMARAAQSRRHLLRLRGQGRKTLRPGHIILNGDSKLVGEVTSFAYAHEDMTFFILACVDAAFRPMPGGKVVGLRTTKDKFIGSADPQSAVELEVLPRFPDDAERDSWIERYGGTC